MKYFFDESGSFRIPTSSCEHSAGVVVGVAIPESVELRLLERFREFTCSLPKSAMKDSEPKGSLLESSSRRRFVELLLEFDCVLVCPAIVDLGPMAGGAAQLHSKLVKRIEDTSIRCHYGSMRDAVALLSRQAGNLSPQAATRLAAWAYCLKRCVEDSIIAHSAPDFDGCWAAIRFEIDSVQPKPGSREQTAFARILPGWLTAWSRSQPFILIKEIHTVEHPFVRNWDSPTGIDLGKIVRDNIHFCRSKESLGIQIADIAASIAYRAVRPGVVSAEDLDNYGRMMSNSIRSNTHAHGLVSFAQIDNESIGRRYFGLNRAIANARQALNRRSAMATLRPRQSETTYFARVQPTNASES
jgi:Protein of unknown function (DUF3800)